MLGPAGIIILVVAALGASLWWARRHFVSKQRQTMRAIHTLSENIIAAESPTEIAEKLAEVLPSITQATTIRLYLYNRATKSLENVPTDDEPEPMAIATETPHEGMANGIVKCFHTLAPLN